MFDRIVVGTDGSPTASAAVERAAGLARLSGAELHIASAYRPISVRKLQAARASLPEEAGWMLSEDSDVNAQLTAARSLVEGSGVEAQTHARHGDPAEVILGIAEEVKADLIVVGNKGMERRVLASAPNSVAHHAPCDVMIVRTS